MFTLTLIIPGNPPAVIVIARPNASLTNATTESRTPHPQQMGECSGHVHYLAGIQRVKLPRCVFCPSFNLYCSETSI